MNFNEQSKIYKQHITEQRAYWQKRLASRVNLYTADADDIADRVARAYISAGKEFGKMAEDILRGFEGLGISRTAAEQLLRNVNYDKSTFDVLKQAVSSISDPEDRKRILAELSAPAYQYRMKRLDDMRKDIAERCNKIYKTELNADKKFLEKEIDTAYKHTIFDYQGYTGIAESFSAMPQGQIDKILETNWSGKHFSERIWGNVQDMDDKLQQTLLTGFMTGQGSYKMADALMERMEVGAFEARRLIRTETTYVCGQAELAAYKETDTEKYEFMAVVDNRTSIFCEHLDGKRFFVKDAKPGQNYPPMHPFCRSTTVAVLPTEEELDAEWEKFTGEHVPKDMDFEDWLDHLVDDGNGKLVYA